MDDSSACRGQFGAMRPGPNMGARIFVPASAPEPEKGPDCRLWGRTRQVPGFGLVHGKPWRW